MADRDDTLRRARKKSGMTLAEVGKRCGVSTAYISDMEYGRRSGSGVLRCVGQVIGLSDNDIDWLYYQQGRLSPDLIFTHEDHVRECLTIFRRNLLA